MSTKKSVVLIGDSIRMGYQATVQSLLADVADVWAPEPNGGDSRNVLEHLDEWVLQRRPDLVHINCGLHDLKKDFDTGQAQVPLDEYGRNVRHIFERLCANADATIIWATTTPVDEKLHHQNKGFDRFEVDVDAYNQAALDAAGDFPIAVDDLFAVVKRAGKTRLLTQDGVHFIDQGSALLGEAVAGCIRANI